VYTRVLLVVGPPPPQRADAAASLLPAHQINLLLTTFASVIALLQTIHTLLDANDQQQHSPLW
jgi:hypothetical protein